MGLLTQISVRKKATINVTFGRHTCRAFPNTGDTPNKERCLTPRQGHISLALLLCHRLTHGLSGQILSASTIPGKGKAYALRQRKKSQNPLDSGSSSHRATPPGDFWWISPIKPLLLADLPGQRQRQRRKKNKGQKERLKNIITQTERGWETGGVSWSLCVTPLWATLCNHPGSQEHTAASPHTLWGSRMLLPDVEAYFPIQALLCSLCLLTLIRYGSEGNVGLLILFQSIVNCWISLFHSVLRGSLISAWAAHWGLKTPVRGIPELWKSPSSSLGSPKWCAVGRREHPWLAGRLLPRAAQSCWPRPRMHPSRSSQPPCNQRWSQFHSLCQWFVKQCDTFLPNAQQETIHPWAARAHFTWSMKDSRGWGMKSSTTG